MSQTLLPEHQSLKTDRFCDSSLQSNVLIISKSLKKFKKKKLIQSCFVHPATFFAIYWVEFWRYILFVLCKLKARESKLNNKNNFYVWSSSDITGVCRLFSSVQFSSSLAASCLQPPQCTVHNWTNTVHNVTDKQEQKSRCGIEEEAGVQVPLLIWWEGGRRTALKSTKQLESASSTHHIKDS